MKKLLICLSLVFAFVLVAGCGGKESKDAAAGKTPKDTLVVGLAQDLATLDPAVSMDNKSWKITYPSYERLVKYKTTADGKASTEVEPYLAESWKASEDGLTWTFILKEGHKFADGSPVDANAVKFSVERVLALKKALPIILRRLKVLPFLMLKL